MKERNNAMTDRFAMMVSPSVLWVRMRTGAWVLVGCEASAGCKQQQLTRASSHEDRALRNVGTRRKDGGMDWSLRARSGRWC